MCITASETASCENKTACLRTLVESDTSTLITLVFQRKAADFGFTVFGFQNTNMASTLSAASNNTCSHTESSYGSRLLPRVVDALARSNPKRIYASFPLSTDFSNGFRDVTMFELANAVNKFAYWLEQNIGASTVFETLAYMGPSDLRYAIVFLATVKCGYKVGDGESR